MKDFKDKIAVITGGGSGMGRELACQLAADGCHVAICDLDAEGMADTLTQCSTANPDGQFTSYICDVSDAEAVNGFKDHVLSIFKTDCVHLLFNNAGIGGSGSFVHDDPAHWERTFNICWYGVYHSARAFLPCLIAAPEARIVNTSSINGFWASLGPSNTHTAYSAAKFAVKGFSEALITDLRLNAPHVKVSVVMPGHIGTNIAHNSGKLLGRDPDDLAAEEIGRIRAQMVANGQPVDNLPDDAIREALRKRAVVFRDQAPTTAPQAAQIILEGIRADKWRILVGEDAFGIDHAVRDNPEQAYEEDFFEALKSDGHFLVLGQPRA